jgi:hypothetical protein
MAGCRLKFNFTLTFLVVLCMFDKHFYVLNVFQIYVVRWCEVYVQSRIQFLTGIGIVPLCFEIYSFLRS